MALAERIPLRVQIENLRATGAEISENITFSTYMKLSLYSVEEIARVRFKILIFDEFHRCGDAVWKKDTATFLKLFPEMPVLDLSATVIRYPDGHGNMAEELFDGNAAPEMALGEAIFRGILAHQSTSWPRSCI